MEQLQSIKNLLENRKRMLRNIAQQTMAQLINLDKAQINAWQQKIITDEEFKILTGQSPQDALRQTYSSDVVSADIQMRNRVEAGVITAKDYEAITGKPYEFGVKQIVDAAVEMLQNIARSIDAAEDATESAEATKTDSSKKAEDGTTAS